MHAGLCQCIDFSFLQSVKNARMHFSGGARAGNNHTERALMARICVVCVLCFSSCVCTQEGADKIVFKKCDAYEGKNLLEMEHKGLTQFPMIFVAMDGQGMGMHTDTQQRRRGRGGDVERERVNLLWRVYNMCVNTHTHTTTHAHAHECTRVHHTNPQKSMYERKHQHLRNSRII